MSYSLRNVGDAMRHAGSFGRCRLLRLGSLLGWTLLLAALTVPAGAAERRIALVIGNSTYASLNALANPGRDAAAMADRLRDLGFEVEEVFNGDALALQRATRRFVAEASTAELALLYFAGHGVQLFDRNFLLASDVDPAAVASEEALGIDLTALLEALRVGGSVRHAILIDACRSNPFSFEQTVELLRRIAPEAADDAAIANARAASRGLDRTIAVEGTGTSAAADTSVSGKGETLLFFAAQPGQVSFDGDGANSFFVEGLREALADADRPLAEILRGASAYVRTVSKGQQVPQLVSDWTADIVLGKPTGARIDYLVSANAGELGDADRELVIRSATGFTKLQGDFIAKASFGTVEDDQLSETDKARVPELGVVNGVTLTYDIDRDGREETLHAFFQIDTILLAIEDEGVTALAPICTSQEAVENIEIGLRDVNGDRKPEIWIAHGNSDSHPWDNFCVLEYAGLPGVAAMRRGNNGTFLASPEVFRSLLDADSYWSVTVANDQSIKTCGGTGCHTWTTYALIEGRYRKDGSESDGSQGNASATTNGDSPIAADMAQFVGQWLSDPDGSAEAISAYLADPVSYYGKAGVARADVVADKQRYYKKWPERSFELLGDTLSVTPRSGPTGQYDLTFQYTFHVRNGTKAIAGRGQTRLLVEQRSQGPTILAEDGEVLERY